MEAKNYNKSTIQALTRYKKMIMDVYGMKIFELGRITDYNINKLINYITNKYSLKSSETIYGFICMIYKHDNKNIPEKLVNHIKNIKNMVKDEHTNNKKEILNNLNLYNVQETLYNNYMKHPTIINAQLYILISLVIDYPFRLNECNLDLFDNNDNNYIDLTDGIIYIRKHKTHKAIGIKTTNLNNNLLDFINQYKTVYNVNHLFVKNHNLEKQTNLNNIWTLAIKTYYKLIDKDYKPFGIHNLRHKHATEKLNEIFVDTEFLNKLNHIRDTMGHSKIMTTITHYLKTVN